MSLAKMIAEPSRGPASARGPESSSTSSSSSASATSEGVPREEMFGAFQTWALKNYGDSGKTKTVTRRKYDRIVRILTGEEQTSAENSKFRFWVKAKGFRLGPMEPSRGGGSRRVLYVPCKTVVSCCSCLTSVVSFPAAWPWRVFALMFPSPHCGRMAS